MATRAADPSRAETLKHSKRITAGTVTSQGLLEPVLSGSVRFRHIICKGTRDQFEWYREDASVPVSKERRGLFYNQISDDHERLTLGG